MVSPEYLQTWLPDQRPCSRLPRYHRQASQRKILMVETKGDHLDNDESKEKVKIDDQCAKLIGKQCPYYMVFETKQPGYPGAYSLKQFMEIVKGL